MGSYQPEMDRDDLSLGNREFHSLYEWFGQKLNSESTLKEDRVCAEQILVNSLIIIDAMSGF